MTVLAQPNINQAVHHASPRAFKIALNTFATRITTLATATADLGVAGAAEGTLYKAVAKIAGAYGTGEIMSWALQYLDEDDTAVPIATVVLNDVNALAAGEIDITVASDVVVPAGALIQAAATYTAGGGPADENTTLVVQFG